MPTIDPTVRLRDFVYHTVSLSTAAKMTEVRQHYYTLATILLNTLQESREKSLALTHLEDSCLRAIQALAVDEGVPVPIGTMHPGNTAAPRPSPPGTES